MDEQENLYSIDCLTDWLVDYVVVSVDQFLHSLIVVHLQ